MASKTLIDTAIKLYQGLGGNLSKVLGTRSNVNFLGKGKSSELMVDMDINPEALGVLPQSKAVEELESAMGYLTSGKLNDIQANQLIKNMQKMDEIYNPPAAPANVTDMATRTRNLDKEGLMSLRQADDVGGEFVENTTGSVMVPDKRGPGFAGMEYELPKGVDPRDTILPSRMADDLPPGSRGGPEDIAAPFSGAGLEAIKNVKGSNLIIDDIVDTIYLNAGVSKAAQPAARGNAREFLNRVKDLEDPTNPGGPSLATIMEVDDFKFMTEGGGGGMGDPMLLVQKYFGPKVASSVAKLDNADDIQKFAENLVKVRDARGNSITSRYFDPDSVDIDSVDVDLDFADGGRVGYMAGARVAKFAFDALRKYGIEGKDISRLFASLGKDKTLVGKEKTAYFKELYKVLKNPDDYPEAIADIQKQLDIDIDIPGFKGGGLAGILEV